MKNKILLVVLLVLLSFSVTRQVLAVGTGRCADQNENFCGLKTIKSSCDLAPSKCNWVNFSSKCIGNQTNYCNNYTGPSGCGAHTPPCEWIGPIPPPSPPSPPPTPPSQPTAPSQPTNPQAGSNQSQHLQPGCVITGGQEVCSLENPIGVGQKGTTEATAIIATVIKTALGIIGALALLMLVWGGFQWLTSAGNPEKVKMGTQTMVWAIIGVLLVFASYMLLSTFLGFLTGGASSSAGGATSGIAGCECNLKVSGTGCSIDQREIFSFGQVVTVGSILDKVSWLSCPAQTAMPDSYKNQSVTVTQTGCGSASQNGSNSGYTYSLQCRVVQ